MSLENLKAAGADLPPGFRITSRVFEDTVSGKRIELGPWGADDLNVARFAQAANSVSGCAGGGAATVCGCAGGGT
jgi:hypothetical protein